MSPYVHGPYIYPPYAIPAMPPPPTDNTGQLYLRIGALESELAHVRSELHIARQANHFLFETYSHGSRAAARSSPETKDHAALTEESKILGNVSQKLRDAERDRSLLQANFDDLTQAYDRLETLSKLQSGTRSKRGGHVSDYGEADYGESDQWNSFKFPENDATKLSNNLWRSPPSSQSPQDGAAKAKKDEDVDLLGGDTYTTAVVPRTAAATGVHINGDEDGGIRPPLKRRLSMYDKAIPRAQTPVFEERFVKLENKNSSGLHENSKECSQLPSARSTAMPESDLSLQPIDLPHRAVLQHQSVPDVVSRHAQAVYRPSPASAWQDHARQAAVRHGYAHNNAPPPLTRPPPYTDLDAVGMLNHRYRHRELDYGESFGDGTAAASSSVMQIDKMEAVATGMIEEHNAKIVGENMAYGVKHNTTNASKSTKVPPDSSQREALTNATYVRRTTVAKEIKHPSVPSFGSPSLANIKATNPRQSTVPQHPIPSNPKALRHLGRRITVYADSDVDTSVAGSRASTPTPATSVPGRTVEYDIGNGSKSHQVSDRNDMEIGEDGKGGDSRDDPSLTTSTPENTPIDDQAGTQSHALEHDDDTASVQIQPVVIPYQTPSTPSTGTSTAGSVVRTTRNPTTYISTSSAATLHEPRSPILDSAAAFKAFERHHITKSESESSMEDGEVREQRSAAPSPTSSCGEGKIDNSEHSDTREDSGDGTHQQSHKDDE